MRFFYFNVRMLYPVICYTFFLVDLYQRVAVHNSSAKYANLSADIANEDRFCLWPAWHGRATVYRLLVCCCFGAVAVCHRNKPAN